MRALPDWRSTSSTAPPSARCTRSPSGSCPSTRSRPGCRPGSRCSTRSARASSSSGGGARSATSCSPTRRSNARSCSCSPPACGPTRSTRSPRAFEANWDLVDERVPGPRPSRPPVAHAARAGAGRARRGVRRARPTAATATTGSAQRLDEIADYADAAAGDRRRARPARGARPRTPRPSRRASSVGNIGRKGELARHRRRSGSGSRDAGDDARRGAQPTVGEACADRLGAAIRRFTLDAAGERRAAGRLEFHDLLVLARALLRDPEHGPARAGPAAPALPAAPARRVPGHRPDPDRARRAHRRRRPRAPPTPAPRRGTQVPVAPGHLFVVGDPEAVDLPVPPGRHLHLPRRPRPLRRRRRRRRRADDQLPHAAPGHRLGQPRVRHAHGASRPTSTCPVPSQPDYVALDADPRRRRRSARRSRWSAEPSTRTRRPADDLRAAEAAEVAATVARGDRRGLVGRRRRRRLAPGPARRHHHPRPGPHVAAVPPGRPRRRRHPVPGRVQLARLRHPGGARPAHGRCGRSTTRPTTCTSLAALRTPLLGLRRRRPVPLQGRAPRALELPGRAAGHRARRRSRCAPASRYLRVAARPAALAGAVGAARPHRPRPAGARARLRRGPAPRRVAPAAVRDRPGPGVERGHRRQPAPVPALGRAADRRGRPGRRGDPARDRRRRRADHDHPRRQGPRVPDHDRVGHVDRPQRAGRPPPRSCSRPTAASATGSAGTSRPRSGRTWAPIDEQMGLDERIRLLYVACTRACDHLVVSLHRKERAQGAGAEQAHQRRAARRRHGRAARRRCPTRSTPTRRGPAGAAPASPDAAAAARGVGGRARRRARARGPARRRSPPPRSPTRARPTRRPSSTPGCRSGPATSTCRRG